MTKAETVLQVILVPFENRVQHFIESYVKLLPDSNLGEFQKILEMKDLKKTELIKLLDAYKTQTSKVSESAFDESYRSFGSANDESSKIKHLESLIQRNK
jgi:succinate dehydrogenase flavin-adding protein (antitoxin of CptAB toxin-antitoxin module)